MFDGLYLSNTATDVFLDVLTLAGSSIAARAWEQHFVLHLADGQRFGLGTVGFDLSELPWTEDCRQEKGFLFRAIDLALSRHRWEVLDYEPARVAEDLTAYRAIVEGYDPVPAPEHHLDRPPVGIYDQPDWRSGPPVELIVLCPVHEVFVGEFGCRLCP